MIRRFVCAFAQWLGSIASPRAMNSRWWNEIDSRAASWETNFCEEGPNGS